MAQQQFNPTPELTTHSEARSLFNANFQDAEDRFSNLEGLNLDLQYQQQDASSITGSLIIDVSNGYNSKITLTEDTALSITGATAGESGVIVIRQDATGGWGLTTSYKILSGLISQIENITINSVGVCSVSWYYDGTEYLLYISDIT